jgi:phospholipase C
MRRLELTAMSKFILGVFLFAATLSLYACGAGSSSLPASATPQGVKRHVSPLSGSTPIEHIVLVIQENRTFNDLFATFPGATGTTVGKEIVHRKARSINLAEVHLTGSRNLNHSYQGFLIAYDNGNVDSFNTVKFINSKKTEGKEPYEYVNPSDVQPYWSMAEQYGLANAMFTTQGSDSFPAHQDLIRGGTEVDANDSLIDNPPYGKAWGCDSVPGTATTLITTTLVLEPHEGPFPCTNAFPYYGSGGYKTLRDVLDAKSVSWKYYTPAVGDSGAIWDAFDAIAPVRFGSEWGTNVNWPETNVFKDIANGTLPAMSWVVPDAQNSDHPGKGADTGPSWVASIVNAVGESSYWNSCAIVVVWDDWGGFYDPVAPPLPRDNQGGPGFRVPMIVISPYSRETSASHPGYISNTFYGFGSIIRFVEDTFDLGRLGTTDTTSNSIGDMFDFNQPPRQFQTIASKYSRSYFLHQEPSGEPVDTQ